MSEPALKLVQNLGDDWPDVPEVPARRAAAAEAAAVVSRAGADPQGGGGHPGARARARVESILLPLSAWASALLAEAAKSMRHDVRHGAPWEEQPVSLVQLREQVMRRAEVHSALPLLRQAYIVWGHLFTLPLAALGYGFLWAVIQSPGRMFLSVFIYAILRATGILPPIFGI